MARIRIRLATTTRAYPATTIEVETPANDTIPLVGFVPLARSIDVTIGISTRKPLTLRAILTILTEATIQPLTLMSTENRIDSVALIALRTEIPSSAVIPLEG